MVRCAVNMYVVIHNTCILCMLLYIYSYFECYHTNMHITNMHITTFPSSKTKQRKLSTTVKLPNQLYLTHTVSYAVNAVYVVYAIHAVYAVYAVCAAHQDGISARQDGISARQDGISSSCWYVIYTVININK